jgi:hypothetical protein
MKYGLEYWQHSLKLYYYQKQLLEKKKKKKVAMRSPNNNYSQIMHFSTTKGACAFGPVPSTKRIFCGFRCYNDKPKRGDVLQPS